MLQLAREVTEAVAKEALARNVSAAKLLLQRKAEGNDGVARAKLSAFTTAARNPALEINVLSSVQSAFDRMRRLHEEFGQQDD